MHAETHPWYGTSNAVRSLVEGTQNRKAPRWHKLCLPNALIVKVCWLSRPPPTRGLIIRHATNESKYRNEKTGVQHSGTTDDGQKADAIAGEARKRFPCGIL